MSESPTEPAAMQPSIRGGVARWRRGVRLAWPLVARTWRRGVEVQEHLLEVNRPWEKEGPLQWQRRSGGWRLVGRHLPCDPAKADGAG